MEYLASVQNGKRPSVRPRGYTELLIEPIGAELDATESYRNWEFDHARTRRFYVGGFLWFLSQTSLDYTKVSTYREGTAEIAKEATWSKMPNSGGDWKHDPSRPQFGVARRGEPLLFQKAAMIIACCELAADHLIAEGRQMNKIHCGQDVYSTLSIIPACWHLTNLNADLVQSVKDDPMLLGQLGDQCAQETPGDLLVDLLSGHTITKDTARNIANFFNDNVKGGESVRATAKPGRKRLGTKSATKSETFDFG